MVIETTTPSIETEIEAVADATSSTDSCGGYISNNGTYNATAESNVVESDDLSDASKSNIQQNEYQSVDATSSLLCPSAQLETTKSRSDYENLSQFNNLNDDENYKTSFTEQISGKNIEVESISSPSSAILSEENNDISKIAIDILESNKINGENINNTNEPIIIIQIEKETNNMTHNSNNTTNKKKNKTSEDTQSVDFEKQQNSQANSKFCLISNDDKEKGEKKGDKQQPHNFNSKVATSALLKDKEANITNKSLCNAKPATINKLLFIICIFSICLFAASICYIVIAHLTFGFNFTYGLAGIFKNEPIMVSSESVTLNKKVSTVKTFNS